MIVMSYHPLKWCHFLPLGFISPIYPPHPPHLLTSGAESCRKKLFLLHGEQLGRFWPLKTHAFFLPPFGHLHPLLLNLFGVFYPGVPYSSIIDTTKHPQRSLPTFITYSHSTTPPPTPVAQGLNNPTKFAMTHSPPIQRATTLSMHMIWDVFVFYIPSQKQTH